MIWNIGKILNFEEIILEEKVAIISKVHSGVADPFVFRDFIFCEAIAPDLENKTINANKGKRFGKHKGGVIVASKLNNIDFQEILRLDESHMSYPHIFDYNDCIFMIPETFQSNEVKVYKCVEFPYDWEFHATIIWEPYCDTTLIKIDKDHYLVAKNILSNKLDLYHFDISNMDARIVRRDILPEADRCGGNLICYNGINILPIQPKKRLHYGERLLLYEFNKNLEFELITEVKKNTNIKSLHHLSNYDGSFYCDFQSDYAFL